jgi:hypothetical protein
VKAVFCSSCGRVAKFSPKIHQQVCIECDELPRACECDPVDTDPPDFCPRCGRRTLQASFSGERMCSGCRERLYACRCLPIDYQLLSTGNNVSPDLKAVKGRGK